MAGARAVTRENFGAWLFKCSPDTWDLAAYLVDGKRTIDSWSVHETYRLDLFVRGQRAFLWASDGHPGIAPGIVGEGIITGRFTTAPPSGYWISAEAVKTGRYAELEMTLFNTVLERSVLLGDPELAQAEVIRQPFGSNPSFLTRAQVSALDHLVGR